MCLERLFVGLRAMVSATCESLATVVAADQPCPRSIGATAILAHVLQRARRENVGDCVQLLLRDEEVGGPMGRGRLRLGARAATMLRRIVHDG